MVPPPKPRASTTLLVETANGPEVALRLEEVGSGPIWAEALAAAKVPHRTRARKARRNEADWVMVSP